MSNVAIVLLKVVNNNIQMFMVMNKQYDKSCADCRSHICTTHLLYGNPAGELEKNETFQDAAIREFLEETDCVLPQLNTKHTRIYKEHDTIIIMSVLTDVDIPEKIVNNDEIAFTQWVDIDEVMKLPLLKICKKMFPKYRSEWINLVKATL